jgi:CO dehydrogenase/acetyl-CoA synthase delta subunit
MTTLEPRIRQAVERRLDEVVEWARQCVEETQITSTKMEESQLHNLLNIDNATDSVKALENFVCYQMGRLKE